MSLKKNRTVLKTWFRYDLWMNVLNLEKRLEFYHYTQKCSLFVKKPNAIGNNGFHFRNQRWKVHFRQLSNFKQLLEHFFCRPVLLKIRKSLFCFCKTSPAVLIYTFFFSSIQYSVRNFKFHVPLKNLVKI